MTEPASSNTGPLRKTSADPAPPIHVPMCIKELIGGNSLCAIYSMGKKSFIGLLLGPLWKEMAIEYFLKITETDSISGLQKD